MSQPRPLLSVVCPAFDEEDVLPLFHHELLDALRPLRADLDIEIIYVDDGSSDGTLGILRQLTRGDGSVRYRSLSRNFGHQAALLAGLAAARGDAVVSLDCDLQHPPSLIPTLVSQWRQGVDVVLTIRADDHRLPWLKRLTSRWFYRVMRRCSGLDVRASASDFRLLSRRAVDALLSMREARPFLRGMVQWLGLPTTEVHFEPDERRAGVSKYTLRRMLRLAADGLFAFSRLPIRLAVGGGLGMLAVSFVLCVLAWFRCDSAGGLATLLLMIAASVHLASAAVLGAVGVAGETLVRGYEQALGRPTFVIKEESVGARRLGVYRGVRTEAA